jgi:hypothetical protein
VLSTCAIWLGAELAAGGGAAMPIVHANDQYRSRTALVENIAQTTASAPGAPVVQRRHHPVAVVNRSPRKLVSAKLTQNTHAKSQAVRLLRMYIPGRHTGVECMIDETHLIIEDPWAGEIERVRFANATIRVDHPRLARLDRADGGLKAPIVVTARNASDGPRESGECVVYSSLLVPDQAAHETWEIIDRLLAALGTLGATVE